MRHPAIYIRVSTEFQAEEGYSIDAQKEQLAAYCVSKSLKNYEFYIDGGWSGSNINRPEMSRLISNIKKNEISHVIVYKLDRLSRSQKDTLYLIEDIFNTHDVAFVSITETLDTSTPMGRLMIGILSAFAQLERENIRMRTRMGMLERVKTGLWMGGGRIPFGYDYDKDNGILVPNKDAETVRLIYKLYLEGRSSNDIAETLGLKYDRLVNQILKRKTNYGVIEYNGIEYQGKHEPLIDKETYDDAMVMMESRKTNRVPTKEHLFTGLLVCGKCGAKMRYQKWGTSGRSKIICYSTQKSKKYLIKDPNCMQEKLWADEVESKVLDYLFSFSEDAPKEKTVSSIRSEKDSVELLREQKAKIESKIKNLYLLFADNADELLLDTIEEQKCELKSVIKKIEIETKQREKVKTAKDIRMNLTSLSDTWDIMTIKEKQNIVRVLINQIKINGEDIEINFNIY